VKRDAVLKQFGQIVAQQRKALNASQEELAHRAGLDRTYISGLERGVRNPSLTVLCRLAAGLGITAGQMLKELQVMKGNKDV
jgi:transcriptional regulator with XRE-family HTH domain